MTVDNKWDWDDILLAITLWVASVTVAFIMITLVFIFLAWIFP